MICITEYQPSDFYFRKFLNIRNFQKLIPLKISHCTVLVTVKLKIFMVKHFQDFREFDNHHEKFSHNFTDSTGLDF